MPGVGYFFIAVAALFAGYAAYSRVVEKLFGMNGVRATPANTMADGVDYIKMPPTKIFLIQFLNIAGVGPVFGPIMGALYGPAAMLWIVLGAILAGGVHDYFAGMLSVRYNGKSIPDVIGYTLGFGFKQFMRVFSIILLVLVGVLFVAAPAGLLASLTGVNISIFVVVIFAYYFLATILPIDILTGRLYPLFAVVLLIMAVGVIGGLIAQDYEFYRWAEWTGTHPQKLPIWPGMFVTIACGALSGFHATQSPLMSRCVPNETCGRSVFYGAMIAEGIIALIWCTAGMTFYESAQALQATLDTGTASLVVSEVCTTLLGPVGGALAILGVVVLPVTSGDTAFRAARLIIADFSGISQKKPYKRLLLAVPVFAVGITLSHVNFTIIWRYFGWGNQTLAAIVLWSAAAYVVKRGGVHWLISLPAAIMTAVVTTFICMEKFGFNLPYDISLAIGLAAALGAMGLFIRKRDWFGRNVLLELPVGSRG